MFQNIRRLATRPKEERDTSLGERLEQVAEHTKPLKTHLAFVDKEVCFGRETFSCKVQSRKGRIVVGS